MQGHTLRAPAAAPTVPDAMAGTVDAVVGLDEGSHLIRPLHIRDGEPVSTAQRRKPTTGSSAPPPDGFRQRAAVQFPPPTASCPTPPTRPSPGTNPLPYVQCGLTPPRLRSAYGTEGTDSRRSRRARRDRRHRQRSRRRPSSPTPPPLRAAATTRRTRCGDGSSRRSSRQASSTCRPTTRVTRRVGTARRPSTSRPCTAWRRSGTSSYVGGQTCRKTPTSTRCPEHDRRRQPRRPGPQLLRQPG